MSMNREIKVKLKRTITPRELDTIFDLFVECYPAPLEGRDKELFSEYSHHDLHEYGGFSHRVTSGVTLVGHQFKGTYTFQGKNSNLADEDASHELFKKQLEKFFSSPIYR
ncbi:hypothetical protein COU57_01705 [Candidatus Pacearchaeota archaeon CG10_big_fil_rev_8_21_14_0_10_32_14]|nr:MAG: hypothetical protein COU57_01705 [Candidatus Pacearchaeota archaeon CG10_big_fil_rev_8_21_14_0_10_32_14]